MKYAHQAPDTLAALASLNLLRGQPAGVLARIARDADLLRVPAGAVIDRAGSRPRQFVGIVDGYVSATAPDGNERLLGAGDQFGAAQLLDARHHTMTYTASTDAVVVVVFGPAFHAVAAPLPGVVAAARVAAREPHFKRALVALAG